MMELRIYLSAVLFAETGYRTGDGGMTGALARAGVDFAIAGRGLHIVSIQES